MRLFLGSFCSSSSSSSGSSSPHTFTCAASSKQSTAAAAAAAAQQQQHSSSSNSSSSSSTATQEARQLPLLSSSHPPPLQQQQEQPQQQQTPQQQQQQQQMEAGQRGGHPALAGGDSQGSSGDLNPSPNEELSDLTGSDLEEDVTWIEWFCGLKGNEMFVFVDEDFVRDDFNLTGLSTQVPYYDKALSLIVEGDLSDDSPSDSISFAYIEKSAALLFGLIHARFILTTKGLGLLQQKVASQFYARGCPNALCDFNFILPCALTDTPSLHTVKLFCARCNELYHPPRSSYLNNIDGAFFGTSVASLFFLTYPHMLPARGPQGPLTGTSGGPANAALTRGSSSGSQEGKKEADKGGGPPAAAAAAAAAAGDSRGPPELPAYYVPKVFGFKVHPDSRKLTLEREEEMKRRSAQLAAAAAAAAPAAAAAASATQQQQQQQETEKWYKPSTGGGASPAGGGGSSQGGLLGAP
ncbi:hypothetical protein Efla_000751 [Eimeria flavescens]